MASSTLDMVLSATDRPITGRSDSLNSNASSLSRRPRIRSRTRTLPEGSRWSDSTGASQSLSGKRVVAHEMGAATAPCGSQVTREQLVAEPVQLPPRLPRSPRRSGMLVGENGGLEVPHTMHRDRKHSTASTRSAKSSRGQNASLKELIDLKNVRDISVGSYILSDLSTCRPLQANGVKVCHVCGHRSPRINLLYPRLTLRAVFLAIATLYRPKNRHPLHCILCLHTRSLLLNHHYPHTL